MRGCFIVFDGIDGCGKSTQLTQAAKRLSAEGQTVVVTREPGGTPIAEKIRDCILSPGHTAMHRECELLLYGAARAQHVREKILPALDRGAVVLCDRFELATFAYQGFGRSIPLDLLERINGIATGGCKPDLTFVFDLPVAVALERLAATGKAPDRLEQESRTFFENVAAGFRTLAAKDPSHIMLIDARQTVAVIAATVYRRITELLQA